MTDARQLRLRAQDLDWQHIEGETVVLDVDASEYLAVNGTGSLLWKSLAGGATQAELADALVDTYSIERERAAADVEAFLTLLRKHALLADG